MTAVFSYSKTTILILIKKHIQSNLSPTRRNKKLGRVGKEIRITILPLTLFTCKPPIYLQGMHGYKIRTAKTTTKCVTQTEMKVIILYNLQYNSLQVKRKSNVMCFLRQWALCSSYYCCSIPAFLLTGKMSILTNHKLIYSLIYSVKNHKLGDFFKQRSRFLNCFICWSSPVNKYILHI